MVLTESEWAAAEPAESVVSRVRDVLKEGESQAYCVDDFFRDAGPSESDEFEPLNALVEALDWQVSKKRSEVLVEVALETLVTRDEAEKRVVEDDERVAYYRTA